MQRTVLLILGVVLFACGQKTDKTTLENKTIAPAEKTTVVFKDSAHDFGLLTAGEIVAFTFEFTNTGTSDYSIERVESDCNCVRIHYKKEPIPAGETGLIEVEFNTAGLLGKSLKTIEVHGNSKELKHLAIFAQVIHEQIEIKY